MRRRSAWLAVLLVVLGSIAGCTGVPHSSSPEVVRSVAINGGTQPEQVISPAPGVQPHTLVQDFLTVNSLATSKHASARSFLIPQAGNGWSDSTVTVLSSVNVGPYKPEKPGQPGASGTGTVTATGTQVGMLSADGIYTPTLQTGRTAAFQASFAVEPYQGQYRISMLGNGLVLTEAQFLQAYVPRSVYYFDPSHRYLVPDARWTADTDPTQVSEVLMNELLTPNPMLSNAISNDALPAQSSSTTPHIDVTGGNPVRIAIPGASQLGSAPKNRLAAQIAYTLSDVDRGRSLQITDSGSPVTIPSVGSKDFDVSDFADAVVGSPTGEVYYVRGHRIVDEERRLLSGELNSGRYPLSSIAVSRSAPGASLTVAGTTTDGRLVIGDQTLGLRRTTVTGTTSRPAFAPGRVEAWVGAGATVYRTTMAGARITTQAVPLPTAVAAQTVVALRLSPEGSRIAVVLRDRVGHQELYTGTVVRTATQVRVDTLEQISPDNVVITDAAWIEGERLNAIGYDATTQDPHVYRTGADGSAWTANGIGELPGTPTYLAGAPGEPAWASAGSGVYVQRSGTTWSNPDDSSSTAAGSAPTYVE